MQTFADEAEALELANDTPYGLASSVFTTDHSRAIRMSRALEFGCVWINTHIPLVAEMPHGGFKESGYGKDLSAYSLEDYTRIKHVMSAVSDDMTARRGDRSGRAAALPQERRLVTEIPGPVSREWTARRQAAVSSAVSVMMPVFAVAAGGGVVVDADGNSLIDFGSGIAVTTVGNAAPQVVAAVQEQVERFTHTCFMITPYAGYVEVAEALNALTPGDHDKRTALFNSGAEAVENAVKIARLATGRSAVAAFDHAYHGRTNLTMALTAKALPYKLGFGPFAPEVYRAPLSYPFHDGLSGVGGGEAGDLAAGQAGRGSTSWPRSSSSRSRARAGSSCPRPGSSRRCSAWCREHGIVFIADEVQSGFARTGAMFACEHEGVVPDLVTTAKGIAGGLPLAGVTGRAEIMNAPHAGGVGGTFGGNPVACAAALASIRTIEDEGLVAAGPVDRVGGGAAAEGAGRARPADRRHPRPGRDAGRRAGRPGDGGTGGGGDEGDRRGGPRPRADPADLRDLRQRPAAPAAAVDAGPPAAQRAWTYWRRRSARLLTRTRTQGSACTSARLAPTRRELRPVRELAFRYASCAFRVRELRVPVRRVGVSVRLLEARRVARAVADDLRLVAREVDDRGRLGAAVAGVDHGVDGVVELFLDLPALGQRLVLVGQQQRRRQQRLAELGQDRLRRRRGPGCARRRSSSAGAAAGAAPPSSPGRMNV